MFAAHLTHESGLAPTTVERHKLLVHRFLQEICPAGAEEFAALTPEIAIGKSMVRRSEFLQMRALGIDALATIGVAG
ncbi:hypothetical protein X727_33170 [Mesorhizobium sp. L103C119B0]|uniref:hypothetical protein n=1 Tax=Mesorhizobium sp. L103C119B0 TaxID=1287085 RepID=UPI0003CFD3C5|nr:hypothetical protein [Mesorhizobium sp. L103C119B0]ESZ55380.1 hypothetical protein X727_33170 [Mesorhizobium sp. L103C119B0]